MPIDASIPLQALTPGQLQQMAYTNQLRQLQVQQATQQAQQQNALMGILREPGSVGDNGMPTPATIGRIMQVNPQAGMTMQNQLARIEENRQRMITNGINQKLLGMSISDKQHSRMVDIATSAQERYDELVSNGTPKDEAARIAGKERNAQIDEASKSGLFSSDQARSMQSPFNPDMNKAFIAGSPQYKRILDEQRAARAESLKEAAPKSDIGKLGEDYKRGLINEQDYKSAVQAKTKMFDPGSVDQMVDMIGQYKVPPISGYALRTPWGQEVMARLNEKYPAYSGQEFHSRQAALAKFTSGQQGNAVRSISVSLDHLDTLQQAGEALKNGNIQSFNRLAQSLAEETGAPAPNNFEAAKGIVADEVIKGIIGAGGGAGDREKAQAIFDKAKSPAQLEGAITQVKSLLRGQLDGLERQYKESTGRDDFDRFLSKSARGLERQQAGQQDQAERGGQKAAGPKKGDTARSKSGRAIVFDGTHWVYQQGAK